MKKTTQLTTLALAAMTLISGTTPALAHIPDRNPQIENRNDRRNANRNRARKNKRKKKAKMLLYIGGTHDIVPCEIPATDEGTTTASCHRHEIINLKNGKKLGWALDATADAEEIDSGMVATGTTTFQFTAGKYAGSELVVRGRGTIQPLLTDEQRYFQGKAITHIAGIFPEDNQNNVLSGTGAFEGASGTFGLFGALGLGQADENIGTFNCIYWIDLDLKKIR